MHEKTLGSYSMWSAYWIYSLIYCKYITIFFLSILIKLTIKSIIPSASWLFLHNCDFFSFKNWSFAKLLSFFLRDERISFQKIRFYCRSLFPERFFSQREQDFNGLLGGCGGAPVWGHYFRQHIHSFHPVCLMAQSNVWPAVHCVCLPRPACSVSCFMCRPTASWPSRAVYCSTSFVQSRLSFFKPFFCRYLRKTLIF